MMPKVSSPLLNPNLPWKSRVLSALPYQYAISTFRVLARMSIHGNVSILMNRNQGKYFFGNTIEWCRRKPPITFLVHNKTTTNILTTTWQVTTLLHKKSLKCQSNSHIMMYQHNELYNHEPGKKWESTFDPSIQLLSRTLPHLTCCLNYKQVLQT